VIPAPGRYLRRVRREEEGGKRKGRETREGKEGEGEQGFPHHFLDASREVPETC
jgi:hypothetical protein